MIFFPNIYKDELIFSSFARYHLYSGNRKFSSSTFEIFSSEYTCSTPILPVNLSNFSLNLPVNNIYTPDYLIDNHTLLPYYSLFLPEDRYLELRTLMKGDNGLSIFMKAGRTACKVKTEEYLKYCNTCRQEEINLLGECYWHRAHQLEGVKICHKHRENLVLSTFKCTNRKNKLEFIPLKEEMDTVGTAFKGERGKEFKHLTFIAEESYYLLNNKIKPIDKETIKKFYISKLKNKGFITFGGRIRWIKLLSEFNHFYGEKLLTDLNCFISLEIESTWIHRLIRDPAKNCHPLRHILLLRFLGETLKSLKMNSLRDEYLPFGEGPWPCLNKSAKHYKELVIPSLKITKDSRTKLPIGTFTCSCGFEFARRGPDKTIQDRYRVGRVKSFGGEWNEQLFILHKQGYSIRKIASLLGVDSKTVKRRLNVNNFNKVASKSVLPKEGYRKKWLNLIKQNKGKTISEIREQASNIYMWLYRNDKKWLMVNKPKRIRTFKGTKSRIDWIKRDELLVKEIEVVIFDILSENNPLVKVSKNEIGRRIGKISWLYKYLNKLPYTEKILNQNVENKIQFQKRRVKQVILNLRKTKSKIKHWEVIRMAGLNKIASNNLKDFIEVEIKNGTPR
ncbi:TnsD family transposase [Rossellomorea vietnamensis]|uniref:TnsD family transposase n=1 Tax=Rossellomorea vietnamensis TaxID=218284 RepID=UPI001CCF8A90|nr:TnsD family transposase [Rossellomorea vietnamensis]MCA0151136.1 TnsD family transposase [Rossellomorea vietnamensis]